ncbi:MAG: hypothetical protein CL677_06690 [Bdellovibrionaceae bacterium]|nr:hypothetical protein [Pseudobdellovibrionaceae bacterium]|tara:strand:- start:103576 stop:104469 length:894 start_codon:yes stop_codon:yes gene_type:complete
MVLFKFSNISEKLINLIFFSWIVLATSACTNVFLQPSRGKFTDPHRFNIQFAEKQLHVNKDVRLTYWHFPAQRWEEGERSLVKPRAMLLHFHGNAQNISSHFRGMMWALPVGLDVVTFDYQGYGSSSGTKDIDSAFSDSLMMLKWAETEAEKKNLPLIVYGQSLGGSLLLKALENYRPKNLKLVVVESSFSDYGTVAREALSRNWFTYILQPLTYFLISNEYSIDRNRVKEIAPVPVILIYGDQDSIVEVSHGKRLYKYLADPKELWIHSNPGHINGMFVEQGKYKKRLIEKMNQLF